jgi:hypothetical protein
LSIIIAPAEEIDEKQAEQEVIAINSRAPWGMSERYSLIDLSDESDEQVPMNYSGTPT